MEILAENALFNSLLVNLIYAEEDYQNGKINVQTLEYSFYQTYRMFLLHVNDVDLQNNWYSSPAIANIKLIIAEQNNAIKI